MKTLIINNHTKHIQELVLLFPNSTVFQKEDLGDVDTNNYDLIIISGGSNVPSVVDHPEQYIDEILLIKNSSIPILGICLGSELITYIYGGELVWLSEKHSGPVIMKVKDLSLSGSIGSLELTAQEGHQVGIKSLSKDLISCAYSNHGIEIIKHVSRPIIGLQFHPEMQKDEKLLSWIFNTLKLVNPGL